MGSNDVIDGAIAMEERARDYYRELGSRAVSQYAGPALSRLADEEQKHVEVLEEYRAALEKEGGVALPDAQEHESTWKGFTTALDEIRDVIQPHTDEITVVQKAVSLEEKGLAFYEKARDCSTDDLGRKVFTFMAGEEVRHRDYLRSLLERLMVLYEQPPETRPQL